MTALTDSPEKVDASSFGLIFTKMPIPMSAHSRWDGMSRCHIPRGAKKKQGIRSF
jgi:hypothetical protein